VKRSQDRERLKENDKLRLQNEQLLEFKSRILEAQTVLQRELSKAKMDAREAIEAKERHADEMSDLSETVEMATLDKEMAEEKVSSHLMCDSYIHKLNVTILALGTYNLAIIHDNVF
jgi:dynactin 1